MEVCKCGSGPLPGFQ